MMATYISVLQTTAPAAGDIPRHRFVTTAGLIAKAGEASYGVSLFEFALGESCTIVALGTAIVESGGVLAKGQQVQSDELGRAIGAGGGLVLGRALNAATESGEEVEVLIEMGGHEGVRLVENLSASAVRCRFVADGDPRLSQGPAVALHAADAAESVLVRYQGLALVEAGGAVSVGAAVQADANGRAIPAAGGVILGYAQQAASELGDMILVALGSIDSGEQFTADGDLESVRFVGWDGAVCPASSRAMGVNAQDVDDSETALARVAGESLMEAGGVIAAGGLVEVGSAGKGVAAQNGHVVAQALEAASADGDIIRVVLLGDVDRDLLELTATATIVANRFVTDAGAQCGAGSAAGGVAANAGETGATIHTRFAGVAYVEAGAAIVAGADVESDASGKAITNDSGEALGVALDAAAADGDIIRVKLD